MPSDLPLVLQTAYAELVERAWMARLETDFPRDGAFLERRAGERAYWYFRHAQQDGVRPERYVGPRSPELDARVAAHGAAREDRKHRRAIVAALLRGGLRGPVHPFGPLIEALAEAGVFRLRGVLVGTLAYQAYAGLLGRRLGGSNLQTGDLDLAQFQSVSVAVEDALEVPLLDTLRRVDPRFEPVPPRDRATPATQFRAGSLRVDLLTPNRGPDSEAPAELPALHAHAATLRYLDFLIYREVQAVILHGEGVAVNVPAPERFALHKLLVSRLRHAGPESQAKAGKDLRQAAELLPVLAQQRPFELREAWEELLARGPRWRRHATEAVTLLPAAARAALEGAVLR